MEYSRQKKDEENKWRDDICPDKGEQSGRALRHVRQSLV